MSDEPPPRKIRAIEFGRALEAAGLVHDLSSVTRITITAIPGRYVTITAERHADERIYLGLTAMTSGETRP